MPQTSDTRRLTRTAYAAHRRRLGLSGGTLRAVQKAISEGRITPGPAGKLDPIAADREWRENTRPDHGGIRPGAGRPRRQKARAERPAEGRQTITLSELRRQREAVRLRRERLELLRLEKDTLTKAETDNYVFKWIRGLRDRLLVIPAREAATGAAELGVDEGTLFRWLTGALRRFLQHEADGPHARQAPPAEDEEEEGQST